MEEVLQLQSQYPIKQPLIGLVVICCLVEPAIHAMKKTMGHQTQSSFCQATKDHYIVVLYHKEHFLNQLGHTA